MDENKKNYIDQTESSYEKVGSQDERTVELDLTDVEQIIHKEGSVLDKPSKKGWRSLLLFTISFSAICAVSIFLLTSFFQGSFLLKNKQMPSVVQEVFDSEKDETNSVSSEISLPPTDVMDASKTMQEPEVKLPPTETGIPDKTETPTAIFNETIRPETMAPHNVKLVDTLTQQTIQEPKPKPLEQPFEEDFF